MSELKVNKVTPRSGTTVTIGDSGEHLALAGNIGLGGATPTTSGTGITFPATASASTNANTLDDYEEGNFGGNSANDLFVPITSGTITMGRGNMAYTKIGRICNIRGEINVSSVASPVGGTKINLPFTTATSSVDRNAYGGAKIITYNVTHTGTGLNILVQVDGGTTGQLIFEQNGGTFAAYTAAAGHTMWIDFDYLTA
jgi:hypothetical protein